LRAAGQRDGDLRIDELVDRDPALADVARIDGNGGDDLVGDTVARRKGR
jgi:hypothetical protein